MQLSRPLIFITINNIVIRENNLCSTICKLRERFNAVYDTRLVFSKYNFLLSNYFNNFSIQLVTTEFVFVVFADLCKDIDVSVPGVDSPNEEQEKAAQTALVNQFTMIQGPPGTFALT